MERVAESRAATRRSSTTSRAAAAAGATCMPEALLCRLTGAEAAVVVNNNAAATMLMLAALASGREVIVSRGELVEIGGGFRVPDVMAQSGAILREVGTTNKTRASDYAAAISERTALILRVHPSNFRIEGFTERPALADLVALGRRFNIPVAEDLGSGHLPAPIPTPIPATVSDPGRTVSEPRSGDVAAGVDVCCFSGDKLLGGPQAGIIVGRAALIDRIRKHPLMRALRVDKMTYAALEATLAEYAAGRAAATVPVQRMLTMTADEIRARAERWPPRSAHPGLARRNRVRRVGRRRRQRAGRRAADVARRDRERRADAGRARGRLRRLTPPIIARIEHDRVLLDLRTVLPEQDARWPRCSARCAKSVRPYNPPHEPMFGGR